MVDPLGEQKNLKLQVQHLRLLSSKHWNCSNWKEGSLLLTAPAPNIEQLIGEGQYLLSLSKESEQSMKEVWPISNVHL